MKIRHACIVGAGAVGGVIAARLAGAGLRVSLLARGATLAAVRSRGLLFQEGGAPPRSIAVEAHDDPAALGHPDLVVLSVKAPALPGAASAVAHLLGDHGVLLTAMNGVPWWFGDGLGGAPLAATDPGGRLAAALPAHRVLGGVVHWASSTPAPGHVRLSMGNRLILGEPAGGTSERAQAVHALLVASGLQAELSPDIRRELWFKLWGNLTFNPVSAFTGATCDRILDDPLVMDFCHACMREAADIGARIGCPIAQTPEERTAVTRQLGAFRTSMLQDVDAGRPVELDALVGAVREIGQRVGVATPAIDTLLGLARLHAGSHGLLTAA